MNRLLNPRVISLVFAVSFAVSAQALYEIEGEPGQQTAYDGVWAYVFAAGALLGFLYVVFPMNRWLAACSCAVMAGACISRAWGLITGPTLTDARSRLGLSVWLSHAFALAAIWALVLMRRRDG